MARAWDSLARSPSIRVLLRLDPKLVQPGGFGKQRGLVGEVGQRRPTPQRKGVLEGADRDERIDGEGLLRIPHERVELCRVQLGGIEPQAVAGSVALDTVGAEDLPEARDVGLDDVPRFLRRFFAPDLVDERLGRHELIRADEQMGEDRALLRSPEWDRSAPRVDLQWPEDAELHPPPVHAPRRLPGEERSHLLSDIAPLRNDRQDVDGIGKPLEVQLAAIEVADAVNRASEVNDALTAQDLAGTGLPAQPRREVQCPTAEPALDLNRLAGIQPDPHGEREIRSRQRLLKKTRLQLDRRPDRLTRRTEDREGLVSPQLGHRAFPSLHLFANDVGEPSRERRTRLVTALLGEDGVSAYVRDQEGLDPLGDLVRRRGSSRFTDTRPVRSPGSLLDTPHAAEYRALDSGPPGRRVVLSVAHGLPSLE